MDERQRVSAVYQDRLMRLQGYCNILMCPVHDRTGWVQVDSEIIDMAEVDRPLTWEDLQFDGCCEAIQKVAALYVEYFFRDAFPAGKPHP